MVIQESFFQGRELLMAIHRKFLFPKETLIAIHGARR